LVNSLVMARFRLYECATSAPARAGVLSGGMFWLLMTKFLLSVFPDQDENAWRPYLYISLDLKFLLFRLIGRLIRCFSGRLLVLPFLRLGLCAIARRPRNVLNLSPLYPANLNLKVRLRILHRPTGDPCFPNLVLILMAHFGGI